MTDSARIHTWGCERHKENTYEGCASCDLEDFSELSSKLSTANARIAELEKQLLARGGHNSDCPVSWKGECYCGWEEMKKSLMVSENK